jgi:DNA-binding MarR family transcriptional regulator
LISKLAGPTLKELAAASQLERSTLGRNIRVLEKQDLVQMKVGQDARTRTIHLTRKGKAAFKRAVPLWKKVQSELLKRIGTSGRNQLDGMLDTLTAPVAA